MSRFTTSPFRKPSPYDLILPNHSSSPSETKNDAVGSVRTAGVMPSSFPSDLDQANPQYSAPITDTTGSRFRRTSSLTYHNSSLRQSLERTVQRSPKMLVVVIPPAAFSKEHGQLGHTLSLGPRHRLSQGVLMPLFPTMYGQLSAIAREYNFPSTTGLCLYLHYWDGGATHTPRISDDTWSFLWGSILESQSPASPINSHLPINGRIEFDIDLTQARWYASWISSFRRRNMDFPISIGTQSMSHSRHDSRTTYAEEQAGDVQMDNDPNAQQTKSSVPILRHVPKKLSLVDRFDHFAGSKQVGPHALPSVVQADEPKTKYDLERRVNSWMAGASLASPSKGQENLLPATIPILPPLDPPEDSPGTEFNLDDFTWTISSPGASGCHLDSPLLSRRHPPSLHLANRVEGSVCLTPSICTSRRPSVYEIHSPVSAVSHVPSLDLGQRMMDDSPPTPSTMTSWGPQSYPPSPLSYYRPPSLDIGVRNGFSQPATPSTATSWGPPLSWPTSPFSEHMAPSIHLGDRGDWSRPVTPSTATSWGAPMSYPPSPSTPFYVHTPNSGQRAFCPEETVGIQVTPWVHVWPYCQVGYEAPGTSRKMVEHPPFESSCDYPYLNIYPVVYPHFDLYPVVVFAEENTNTGYPHFNLYPTVAFRGFTQQTKKVVANADLLGPPAVNRTLEICPAVDPELLHGSSQPIARDCSSPVFVKLTVQYPSFDLYPAVYPNVAPYPPKIQGLAPDLIQQVSSCPDYDADIQSKDVSVHLGAIYPVFDLYTTMYPVLNIYPAIRDVVPCGPFPKCSRKSAAYPTFDLYPVVYPHFDLYPATSKATNDETVNLTAAKYPSLNLYPAAYPHFEIYGPSTMVENTRVQVAGQVEMRNHALDLYQPLCPCIDPYPANSGTIESDTVKVTIPVRYPVVNLYPPVYPHFDLYPAKSTTEDSDIVTARLPARYPAFDLYPPGYPHFDLYPAKSTTQGSNTVIVESPVRYPVFDLYPPGYPHFDLYPAKSTTQGFNTVIVKSPVRYPAFDPYPPGYPHFDLYPAKPTTQGSNTVIVKSPVRYPLFDLYPPGYPHFDIYPAKSTTQGFNTVIVKSPVRYPVFDPSPPGYPHFDLYPAKSTTQGSNTVMVKSPVRYPVFDLYPPYFDLYSAKSKMQDSGIVTVRLPARYPTFDLYPPVYPHLDIYYTDSTTQEPDTITVRLPAIYPAFDLYPSIYPHLNLWPSILQVAPTLVSPAHQLPPKKFSRSTPAGSHLQVKPSKSHNDLHNLVFPDGNVSTPSGTTTGHNIPDTGHYQRILVDEPMRNQFKGAPKPYHSMSPNGTVSTAVGTIENPRPKPGYSRQTHQQSHHVPPTEPSRFSTSLPFSVVANDSVPTGYRLGSDKVRPASFLTPNVIRQLPATPANNTAYRISTITSPTSPRSDFIRAPLNPPKGNPPTAPPTNRSRRGIPTMSSQSDLVVSPPRSVNDLVLYHTRSLSDFSPSPRPPRKRDSLVLQRVKTYSNLPSANDSEASPVDFTSTLAKFPMPPLPPVPPVPTVPRADKASYATHLSPRS